MDRLLIILHLVKQKKSGHLAGKSSDEPQGSECA